MNPYGAVPAALNQTRLSLRDIMASFVDQKIQESKLSLANKQMDVEARALELDAEKQKTRTAFDLARVARETVSQDRLFKESQSRTDLAKLGHQEQVRANEAREPILANQAETAKANAQLAARKIDILDRETRDRGQIHPWSYHLDRNAFTPARKEVFLGLYDKGKPVTGIEAEQTIAAFNKQIGPQLVSALAELKGQLGVSGKVLANLTPDDPKRKEMEQVHDAALAVAEGIQMELNYLKSSTTKITPKDLEKMDEAADKIWMLLSDEDRKKYPGGEPEFIEKYKNDSINRIAAGIDQLKSFRRQPGEKEPKPKPVPGGNPPGKKDLKSKNWVGTKNTLWLNDQCNEIEKTMGKPKGDEARNKVTEFLKARDYLSARDYLTELLGQTRSETGNKLFSLTPGTSSTVRTPAYVRKKIP